MTDVNISLDAKGRLIPESEQTAVWLLGGLAQVRVPGSATRDTFAVTQHTGTRGYTTPLHTHEFEDEVFIVIDGTLRMVCDGEEQVAEAGSTMIVPMGVPHGFVTTSENARFLTIHSTPAEGRRPQFDRFLASEFSPAKALTLPTEEAQDSHQTLDWLIEQGKKYAYSYAGPAPTP